VNTLTRRAVVVEMSMILSSLVRRPGQAETSTLGAGVGAVVTMRAGVGGPQEDPGILLREDARGTPSGVASGA
jgi:hypothetical protein